MTCLQKQLKQKRLKQACISDKLFCNIILISLDMLRAWKWAVNVSYIAWSVFRSRDRYSPAGIICWVKDYTENMRKHYPYSNYIEGQNFRGWRSHLSPEEEPGGHHRWWNVNFLLQPGWKLQLLPLLFKFLFCIPSSSLSFTSFLVQIAPIAAHMAASFTSSEFYRWSLGFIPLLYSFSSGLARSDSRTVWIS